MFSHQVISQFRAFGYAVIPGLLTASEVAQLRTEVTRSIQTAFGGVGTDADGVGGGIRGDYLPLSVDRAPLSQALMADDERFYQGSVVLTGGPTVPTVPLATCFTSNAGWHNDDGTEIGGVKFLAHLEPRRAATGALRVIPGTHDPAFRRRVEGYFGQDPGRQGFAPWPAPAVVLETDPGDVIAFDLHLFHSSVGGDKRLAWTIEYLPWPGLADAARLAATRNAVRDIVDYDHEGYDRDVWPTWREWAAGADASDSRQTAVERLRLMGVLGDGDPR